MGSNVPGTKAFLIADFLLVLVELHEVYNRRRKAFAGKYIRLYAPHVEKCGKIVLGGVLVADHASLRKPPVVFELENKTHDILE